MSDRPLRVCYFGTYRANYARNRIMIEGLRRNGVDVIECHEKLWDGIEDRVETVGGGWKRPRFWWRMLRTYSQLVRQYLNVIDHDIVVVGYPGQFDVFIAALVSRLRGTPLVWDIFMSIYLISIERGLDTKSPAAVTLLRWIERLACRLPDLLILDTEEYVNWFDRTHGVPAERFRLVPTGADSRIFQPATSRQEHNGLFRAAYYGTFIPNHGVEYIIEAAHLLADDPTIRLELIGRGPDRDTAQTLASRYGLNNVDFVDWLEPAALRQRIAEVDVCLGVFGTTPQSLMTVQNKIYEGLALGKPIITGDGPAVRDVLTHREHVYLCERANPESLRNAIYALRDDAGLRRRLARRGHEWFQQNATVENIGQRFKQHLLSVV